MSGLAPEFNLLRKDWPLLAASDERVERKLNVTAAFDGEPIAQVAVAGERHVQDALFAAFAMFRQKDRWLSVQRRIEILTRLSSLVGEHADLLVLETARESGKPVKAMALELRRAQASIEVAIAELVRPATQARYEPGGVVVALLGSAHPLELAMRLLVAALAAGCPIILKPADPVPLAALRLVHLLHEAGLPYVWAQCVVTETDEVAGLLVNDPRVALVSFSGTAAVGWSLRSQLPPGTRCLLDHGGVTPAILAADANWQLAIPALIAGAFTQPSPDGGRVQRCYVPRLQLDEFAAALSQQAEQLQLGDPLSAATDVGALLDAESFAQTQRSVEAALTAGATLVTGGAADRLTDAAAGERRLYAPTVVVSPPIAAEISSQPVFGPVLALFGYDDIDAACDMANALPYGYSALVFTESAELQRRLYEQLDASLVLHNGYVSDADSTAALALTGLRRSGLGSSGVLAVLAAMRFRKYLLQPANQ